MSNEQEAVEGDGSLLTRRELLGASAALGTAAIASGGGAVGSADAQTTTEPRIQLGEDYAIDDNPDGEGDLVLEHLASGAQLRYDSSEDSWSVGSFSAGGVSSKTIGTVHYTEAYSGADADSRLGNAISAASPGDTIQLENDSFNSDRNISKSLTIRGTTFGFGGAGISATWTISTNNVYFFNVGLNDTTTIDVNDNNCAFLFGAIGGSANVDIGGDRFRFNGNLSFGTVTFESGTSEGVADGNSGGGTITDNGTNVVGDNA